MMIKKLTPVLAADAIEPVLPLWEAAGFTKTAEVPHGDKLGFVILAAGAVEVMYQTRASIAADNTDVSNGPRPLAAAVVFIEVDDIEALNAALPPGTSILFTNRKTFYGATETAVRDADGNVIVFAQMS